MNDHAAYRRFMQRAEFEKAVNSLAGIIEGISLDTKITDAETQALQSWLDTHRADADKHPYSEVFPALGQALSDGVLNEEEKADLVWLCKKLTSAPYFDGITSDMQKLHGLLAGVAADGHISREELQRISAWMQEHEHLKRSWPYEEVESLISCVMEDQKIEPEEHKMLLGFFTGLAPTSNLGRASGPVLVQDSRIDGLCAVCPEIAFTGAVFCLTGASHKYSRAEFMKVITGLGGTHSGSMTERVNYLIVGADGNPCWAYACYGRKVERAVELRKKGHQILIVHENDFHDAVADNPRARG